MNVHLLPYANPRSKKNYIKTILNHAQNCKTTEIKKYYPDLPEVYNKNSYPIWGVTNGGRDCNKKPWSKMKANDVAVFYKDRKFDNYCLILDKFNSNEFARKLWGQKFNKDLNIEETWENMFLIKDLKPIDISIDIYNDCFGHSKNNLLQGYTRLDEDKSELFLDAFNFIEIDKKSGIRLSKELKGIESSGKLVQHRDGVINSSLSKRTEREITIEQKEMKLVSRYKKFIEKNNLGTFHRYKFNTPGESTILETDGWIAETKTLIEAKASSTRSNIRMAIGQLMDYKRHHDPKPQNLAILLPSCPRKDLVDLIFSQNIDIIFEKGKEFITKHKD